MEQNPVNDANCSANTEPLFSCLSDKKSQLSCKTLNCNHRFYRHYILLYLFHDCLTTCFSVIMKKSSASCTLVLRLIYNFFHVRQCNFTPFFLFQELISYNTLFSRVLNLLQSSASHIKFKARLKGFDNKYYNYYKVYIQQQDNALFRKTKLIIIKSKLIIITTKEFLN